MRRFSTFCVLFLQMIVFAQPILSQSDWDDDESYSFVPSFMKTVKQCSTIDYPLQAVIFSIETCLDKSSQALNLKLKVGDIDLAQAKGTFDDGASISFDHGSCLNGNHRYYLKENELWLHYNNKIFGKEDSGDMKLHSLPRAFVYSEGSPKHKPKEDPTKSTREYSPKPKREESAPKHKSKRGEATPKSKSKGNANVAKSKSKQEL